MSFLKRNTTTVSEKSVKNAGEKAEGKTPAAEAPDVEAPPETFQAHTPMTWKKFMAIFSLGCLLAAAQIPLYLIGGTLSNPHQPTSP